MTVYEVRMFFPEMALDDHRRFLASVTAGQGAALQGFRQHGNGVVLKFVVETDAGIDFAVKAAIQRATGLWPIARPSVTTVRIIHAPPTRE